MVQESAYICNEFMDKAMSHNGCVECLPFEDLMRMTLLGDKDFKVKGRRFVEVVMEGDLEKGENKVEVERWQSWRQVEAAMQSSRSSGKNNATIYKHWPFEDPHNKKSQATKLLHCKSSSL